MINENATAPYRLISNLVKGGNHSKEENISEGGGGGWVVAIEPFRYTSLHHRSYQCNCMAQNCGSKAIEIDIL